MNQKNKYGDTALHVAAEGHFNYSVKVIKLLLQRDDLDVNLKNHEGESPLFTAMERCSLEMVRVLLTRSDIPVDLEDTRWQDFFAQLSPNRREEISKLLGSRTVAPDQTPSTSVVPASSIDERAPHCKRIKVRSRSVV